MPKFNAGDEVKFLDNLWEEKKCLGKYSDGFFSSPLRDDANNCFRVFSFSIQDEDSIEYQLSGFPLLVWEEELESVCVN
jgi:hypothetical protein